MGRYTLCHGPVDDETFIEHYLEQPEALRAEYQMLLHSLKEAKDGDRLVDFRLHAVVYYCERCDQLQCLRSMCNFCHSTTHMHHVGEL